MLAYIALTPSWLNVTYFAPPIEVIAMQHWVRSMAVNQTFRSLQLEALRSNKV